MKSKIKDNIKKMKNGALYKMEEYKFKLIYTLLIICTALLIFNTIKIIIK